MSKKKLPAPKNKEVYDTVEEFWDGVNVQPTLEEDVGSYEIHNHVEKPRSGLAPSTGTLEERFRRLETEFELLMRALSLKYSERLVNLCESVLYRPAHELLQLFANKLLTDFRHAGITKWVVLRQLERIQENKYNTSEEVEQLEKYFSKEEQ